MRLAKALAIIGLLAMLLSTCSYAQHPGGTEAILYTLPIFQVDGSFPLLPYNLMPLHDFSCDALGANCDYDANGIIVMVNGFATVNFQASLTGHYAFSDLCPMDSPIITFASNEHFVWHCEVQVRAQNPSDPNCNNGPSETYTSVGTFDINAANANLVHDVTGTQLPATACLGAQESSDYFNANVNTSDVTWIDPWLVKVTRN